MILFFGTTLWIASGAPTIDPTVCRGFSEVYGSWKIIWTSRRSGLRPRAEVFAMSRPSNSMAPAVGS